MMHSVIYNQTSRHFVLALAALLLLAGCSATGKALKRGDEAEQRGDFYAAAQEYMGVLATKPKHGKSLQKLSAVAQKAYDQKLGIAQSHEKQDNLEQALDVYKQVYTFLDQIKRYQTLTFVPINIENAIKTVSSGAAEKHYKQAESLFGQQQFLSAISAYREALELTAPYKDASEKIAQSHYLFAERAQNRKQYRDAAVHFHDAHETRNGFKDAADRAARLYYQLGQHFLKSKYCRNAYEDFSKAHRIAPLLEGLAEKREQARACATTKIAFVEFDNPTGQNLAGMALGDFIFETIKTKVQRDASQFIKMLDREQLEVLAREQQIAAGGGFADMASTSKLEGVDFLIFGKINQVQEVHPGISKREMQTTYRYPREIIKTNNKGKSYKTYEMRDANMIYTVHSDRRSIKLAGAIRVVDAKSGAVAINFQIAENANDAVEYAAMYKAVHDLSDRNLELNAEFVRLSQARKELREVDALAKEMIDRIAAKMSSQILRKLDRTPNVSDPRQLPVSGT